MSQLADWRANTNDEMSGCVALAMPKWYVQFALHCELRISSFRPDRSGVTIECDESIKCFRIKWWHLGPSRKWLAINPVSSSVFVVVLLQNAFTLPSADVRMVTYVRYALASCVPWRWRRWLNAMLIGRFRISLLQKPKIFHSKPRNESQEHNRFVNKKWKSDLRTDKTICLNHKVIAAIQRNDVSNSLPTISTSCIVNSHCVARFCFINVSHDFTFDFNWQTINGWNGRRR